MQKFLRILSTVIVIVASCTSNFSAYANVGADCDDVQFIFARGSGENLSDASYLSWQTAIEERLQSSNLRYSFYELGSASQDGAQYPAVAVAGSLGGFGNLLGAFISAGRSFEFGKSVLSGRNELKSYLKQVSSACPRTKFVLGGYSQGAMVLSGILDEINASRIIYVATFGDPKLYLPEGAGKRPDACRGKNLSNYRTYVTDCHAYEGVLGSYRPYQPTDYFDKLGTWCNGQDMMCSSGLSIADHTSYSDLGLYRNAASAITSKLRQAFPQAFTNVPVEESEFAAHDLVILLHGGGDMDGLTLAQYKLAAGRLANQIYSLGGGVALYVYGDNNKWNPRQLCDFSCSADEFNKQLAQITHRISAVDYYNSALSSLHQAMSELNWQIGATKSAVLLTNQPYSRVDYNGRTVAEVAELSLSIDPVNIYTFTQTNNLDAVQPLSVATNGKVYDIEKYPTAITEISGRPMATLTLENYEGIVGEEFTFDASNNISTGVRYDWDLDADGVFELQTSTPVVQKIYQAPLSGYIQVRVIDQNNYSSTMSARLKVTAASASVSATINNIRVTALSNTEYRLDFATDAERVLVAIGDLPVGQLLSSRQSITINDVTTRTTVRLIPYNSITGRGEAVTVEIGPYPITTPEENFQTPSSAASTPPQTTQTLIKKPADSTAVFVPKAPNTGVSPH